MTTTIRRLMAAATLALAAPAAGCAGTGWDDVLHGSPGRTSNEVTGTVSRVDSRDQTIQMRDDRGRDVRVRYDRRTRVTYRGRDYRPDALERGDLVTARLQRDRSGDLYTRQVIVRRDARGRDDRPRDGDREVREVREGRQTLDGRVARVDRNDGRFQLRTGSRTVWITLPYRPSGSIENRFRRLRQGDRIRVQGRWIDEQRFELDRFR